MLIASSSYAQGLKALKQPLSDLRIAVSGCTYKIFLNGVPIYQDDDGLPLTAEFPMNEWMRLDENTLSMQLGPVKDAHQLAEDGDKCQASIELAVRENGQPKSAGVVISKLSYETPANHFWARGQQAKSSIPDGNYKLGEGKLVEAIDGNIIQEPVKIQESKAPLGYGVTVSREIKAPLNYPKKIWSTGEIIPDNAETKAELTKFFEQLFHDVQTKNMPALESLFKVRTKLLREAYYLPKNSSSTFDELKTAVNDSNMELYPLHKKFLTLKIFGEGKLAKLYYGSVNSALLTFNYKKIDASKSFEIILAKIKGKWVIVG